MSKWSKLRVVLDPSASEIMINTSSLPRSSGTDYIAVSETPGSRLQDTLIFYVADVSNAVPHRSIVVPSMYQSAFSWLMQGSEVWVSNIGSQIPPAVIARTVEISVSGGLLSRDDQFRLMRGAQGHVMLTSQRVGVVQDIFSAGGTMGHVRTRVHRLLNADGQVISSGYVGRTTDFLYRSENSHVVLLVEAAVEMWQFEPDADGDLLFERCQSAVDNLAMYWSGFTSGQKANDHPNGRAVPMRRFPGRSVDSEAMSKQEPVHHVVTLVVYGRLDLGEQSEDFFWVLVNKKEARTMDPKIVSDALEKWRFAIRSFILMRSASSGASLPYIRVSSSYQANVLESVNLVLDQVGGKNPDIDLEHFGTSILVLTAGMGHYIVDRELLRVTIHRLQSLGLAVQFLSSYLPPLHQSPLFTFKDTKEAKESDHLLYVQGSVGDKEAHYVPRCMFAKFDTSRSNLPHRMDRFLPRARCIELSERETATYAPISIPLLSSLDCSQDTRQSIYAEHDMAAIGVLASDIPTVDQLMHPDHGLDNGPDDGPDHGPVSKKEGQQKNGFSDTMSLPATPPRKGRIPSTPALISRLNVGKAAQVAPSSDVSVVKRNMTRMFVSTEKKEGHVDSLDDKDATEKSFQEPTRTSTEKEDVDSDKHDLLSALGPVSVPDAAREEFSVTDRDTINEKQKKDSVGTFQKLSPLPSLFHRLSTENRDLGLFTENLAAIAPRTELQAWSIEVEADRRWSALDTLGFRDLRQIDMAENRSYYQYPLCTDYFPTDSELAGMQASHYEVPISEHWASFSLATGHELRRHRSHSRSRSQQLLSGSIASLSKPKEAQSISNLRREESPATSSRSRTSSVTSLGDENPKEIAARIIDSLIAYRLSRRFQLYRSGDMSSPSSTRVSYLSRQGQFHCIFFSESRLTIRVNTYRRKWPGVSLDGSENVPRVINVAGPLEEIQPQATIGDDALTGFVSKTPTTLPTFIPRQVGFFAQDTFLWEPVDRVLAGLEQPDGRDSLKYSRVRFALLPKSSQSSVDSWRILLQLIDDARWRPDGTDIGALPPSDLTTLSASEWAAEAAHEKQPATASPRHQTQSLSSRLSIFSAANWLRRGEAAGSKPRSTDGLRIKASDRSRDVTPDKQANNETTLNESRPHHIPMTQTVLLDLLVYPQKTYHDRVICHYDRSHNVNAAFHFELNWFLGSGIAVANTIRMWRRRLSRAHADLVEVPIQAPDPVNPFQGMIPLHVTRAPSNMEDSPSPRRAFLYERAVLLALDFLLDLGSCTVYDNLGAHYSYRHDLSLHSRYVHRSGSAFIVVLKDEPVYGRWSFMRNIWSSETPSVDPLELYERVSRFCADPVWLDSIYANVQI